MVDKINSFERIFNYIIIPLVCQIEEEVDEEFKSLTNLRTIKLDDAYSKCNDFYKTKKDELKKIFYGDKISTIPTSELLFDIHKIASITCYSLIKHKIFVFDEEKATNYIKNKKIKDTTWIIDNVLVNYKLAFKVSVAMIYYKLLFDFNKLNNFEIETKLKEKRGLFLYNVREGHESFNNSIILDLAKRDIHKRSFDYFLYSALLFQLEEYNREFFINNKQG